VTLTRRKSESAFEQQKNILDGIEELKHFLVSCRRNKKKMRKENKRKEKKRKEKNMYTYVSGLQRRSSFEQYNLDGKSNAAIRYRVEKSMVDG
jgi:hypothetical protein